MGLVLVVALLVGSASLAGAHVTVNPKEAPGGSFAKLSFRVPNERDNAATVALSVQLPQEHPLAYVSVKPVPGWTAEVVKRTLTTPVRTGHGEITEVVDRITWTGGRIEPGQFQEFDVSVGPLPTDVDQLVFPAIQRYESGEEVAWIERPAGDEEPEHPAPVLRLTPSAGDAHGSSSPAGGKPEAEEATVASSHSDSQSGTDAVAWVAVALGALGVVLALAAMVRANRAAS